MPASLALGFRGLSAEGIFGLCGAVFPWWAGHHGKGGSVVVGKLGFTLWRIRYDSCSSLSRRSMLQKELQ